MKTLLFAFLMLVSSCGASPLFNHDVEKAGGVSAGIHESDSLSFKKTTFSFSIAWEEGPRLGESKFLMRTWDRNSGSINGPYQDLPRDLHVFLWMRSMGHGSSPVTITKVSEGEYEVSDVQFIMGGLWDVRFQLKDGSQVFDETSISLSL